MALYRQDFIERVRAANDLAQVAASYNIQLKRTGGNLIALCPFHNEKTPSFNIRPADQYFHCFGCGEKGDVFGLVQKLEKVEFPEAVRLLAERAGLQPEYAGPAAAREAEERGREKGSLLWCCSRALDYFEECLAGPKGAKAREYLAGRGFSEDTVRRWRLGWAPDAWDGLTGFLLKNAREPVPREKALAFAAKAGLIRIKEDGPSQSRHYYDAFRGRVMFPILDSQSRPVAFGGRLLEEKPEAGGKYINSAESRIFEKRRTLFGLPQAGKEIALSKEAILVEGYVDVIMCHQYGLGNVVAVLGTALTEDHLNLLRRQTDGKGRVVAFFDSDPAGEKATLKAIAMFMAQDMPLAVAGALELKDAGEFLPRHGAEKFRERLSAAEDSFSYLLARTVGRAKNGGPDALSRAVRELMETVNLCPDPVKLALMRRRAAAEAGVPDDTLPKPKSSAPTGASDQFRIQGSRARPAAKPGLKPPEPDQRMENALARRRETSRRREARLLRYLWESPAWSERLLDAYPPDEWRSQALAELAAAIRDERLAGCDISLPALRARTENPDAAKYLAELAFADSGPPLTEREFSELLDLVLAEGLKDGMREVRSELAVAGRTGDSDREDELLRDYMRLRATGRRGRI
ncbi:MAG: DNA primase [Planctomycetota bacterium]|jgi:DNA primase|nr:DNA primase [Planctomycetota bacterium]